MYTIAVFVPKEAVEKVKEAMFAKGAGKIGNYDRCCWQCEGIGQFRPLPGSHAYIGNKNHLEHVPEIKVEILCPKEKIADVLSAMKKAHPYEVPAYAVIRLEQF